jgi:hypothetical protein
MHVSKGEDQIIMAFLELLTFTNALLILTVGLGLLVLYVLVERWLQTRVLSTIPSPDGNVWLWGRPGLPPNAIDVMRRWAREYGELFRLRIGWYDWVVINSPEAFKEIFDKQVSPHEAVRKHTRRLTDPWIVNSNLVQNPRSHRP